MNVAALLRLSHQAAQTQDWPALDRACARLLAQAPEHAEARLLWGVAALERRQLRVAIERLRGAVQLAPASTPALAQLARALSMAAGQAAEAQATALRALALGPGDASTLDTLGVVLSRTGEHAVAADAFARAAALVPQAAGVQFNLASSLKFIGRFEQAEEAYEACLAADPKFWKAHSALSQLRRQTPARNHIARLEPLLAAAPDAQAGLHLHMALAKEHEDLGEYTLAFQHLVKGKSARRAQLDYSFAHDDALFDALEAAFAAAPPPLAAAPTGPVFVVGMPRTGTTLVERILSSHPALHGAGELQDFALAVKRAAATASRQMLDPETIRAAAQFAEPRGIGKAYLESTARRSSASRLIDKMPLNFLYAGLIARALPQARIVCLRRDPLDTCLSNFRQLFALDYSYYNYAYDLLDTGRYYLRFARLCELWRRTLAAQWLELPYEELVTQPRPQIERLLAFCGLPWDEACLHAERNPAPVSTASSVQVRQPIHAGAVGRWRRYQRESEPLRALLAEDGITLPDR